MKYKAVFFDFDGTLMDTSEGIFAGSKYAMECLGLEISKDADWEKLIGPPLKETFRIAFDVQDNETLDRLSDLFRDYYRREGLKKACFYPGIMDVVKELKKRGYLLGIATMKSIDLAIDMSKIFGMYEIFDSIFGLNLAGTNKKADVLKDGFKQFGLKPSECVLVGDTTIDEEGAKIAGCDIIKCNWGFGFTVKDEGTISRAEEILDLV